MSYMRTTFILDGFLVGCDLASLGLTATSSGLIFEQNYSSLIGIIIGEASNPGPRLRRRGPRSSASMAARQGRREASVEEASDILEGQQTCSEKQ